MGRCEERGNAVLIEPGAELEKVASGAIWSEGPVWLPDSATLRFSDIPNNRILQFYQESGELTVYRDEVGFTNGRTLDLDGSVGELTIVGAQPVGIFEQAALDAVRNWRYQPVMRAGQAVSQRARVRLRFAMQP